MKYSFYLFILALIAVLPAHAKVTSTEGRAEIYVEVRSGTEVCGAAASPSCRLGQACFVTIYFEGQAAQALYEVMRPHGSKMDVFSGNQYLGTQPDGLACFEDAGAYSCQIGYDAVSNKLTKVVVSDCE
jgi:hypothetical protein